MKLGWRPDVPRKTDVTRTERIIKAMLRSLCLASLCLIALAAPVRAQPPADLDACLALLARITRSGEAKVKFEAEYVKFHSKHQDLLSACGQRDFVTAEKIANDIRATFHLD
ncbi:hypothetical protein PY365_22880 [Roseiarcaceae bacterium H3SJ34-1]|uniref:hypothetical protein n=1 Tax=Terripilifer ovatus TaxID=3032367 RepID=UPI003AB97C21|nr:hypothetical protein [Roseiarcaceae bacterium H3SJ34-1]